MFLLSLTLGLVADLLRQILRSWVSAFSGVGGVSVVCFSGGREEVLGVSVCSVLSVVSAVSGSVRFGFRG